jgi:hypothetical protein
MVYLFIAAMAAAVPIIWMLRLSRNGRSKRDPSVLSDVSRQHLELFQGAQFSELALARTKRRFRALLNRGDVLRIESSLIPGTAFAVQVRALADIGSEAAGKILERQLRRRLSTDSTEQEWYWLDLANSLRTLNRRSSLPLLIRCTIHANLPLGYFLAAEVVCFRGFRRLIRQSNPDAIEVLRRAFEGLRFGVPPHVFAAAKLANLVQIVLQQRNAATLPALSRLCHAALRWGRLAPKARRLLQPTEHRAFARQMRILGSIMPKLEFTLTDAKKSLVEALHQALPCVLQALAELGVECGEKVIRLIESKQLPWTPETVAILAESCSEKVGRRLIEEVFRRHRRLRWLGWLKNKNDVECDIQLIQCLIAALQQHEQLYNQDLLVALCGSSDRRIRCAALGGLGYLQVVSTKSQRLLSCALRDSNLDVSMTAAAALARLGEWRSLQSLRSRLASENPETVHTTIDWIARFEVTLLWPELSILVAGTNPEIAFHAAEALATIDERLCRRNWPRNP